MGARYALLRYDGVACRNGSLSRRWRKKVVNELAGSDCPAYARHLFRSKPQLRPINAASEIERHTNDRKDERQGRPDPFVNLEAIMDRDLGCFKKHF